MHVEQLLLVLPGEGPEPSGTGLTVHHWSSLLDQFAARGGREVMLGGAEPLRYPGFRALVRRAVMAGIPRVTVLLSGSLLEPWVLRSLVESGVHVLVAMDSLQADLHDALHGYGSHARAVAAVDTFLKQGVNERVGLLATVTRANRAELPMLAAWAAGRRMARVLWTVLPECNWPSAQLRDLTLAPTEAAELALHMESVIRSVADSTYVAPVEDPSLPPGYSPILRVTAQGDAWWGFAGEGGLLGNLRSTTLGDLVQRGNQAAGD